MAEHLETKMFKTVVRSVIFYGAELRSKTKNMHRFSYIEANACTDTISPCMRETSMSGERLAQSRMLREAVRFDPGGHGGPITSEKIWENIGLTD